MEYASADMTDLKQRLHIKLEGEGYIYEFATTGIPLNKDAAMDWFEYQVLPAIGYSAKEKAKTVPIISHSGKTTDCLANSQAYFCGFCSVDYCLPYGCSHCPKCGEDNEFGG